MIICFSGCGNSADVARRLAHALREPEPLLLRGEAIKSHRLNLKGDGRVVWVFPVYSWGIPPVVIKYINDLTLTGAANTTHHLVVTCGDDAGLVDRQWRELMSAKGYKTASASSVIMPNTYVLMKGFDVDSDEVAKAKLEASKERVGAVAETIMTGREITDIKRGSFARVKSRMIYPWFVRHSMSPKPFHADVACVGCGACVKQCPMENIVMTDNGPKWGDNCALCLGCYHICPHHAVAYGTATRKKGQYILLDKR